MDEIIDVPPPGGCPACDGDIVIDDVVPQWREEIIPALTRIREYR